MKSLSTLLAISLCAFLLAQPCFATDNASATKWLSKEQEQALSDTVPPPPAVDSAEDKADHTQVLAAQNGRTPGIIAECKQYQTFGYKPFFEDLCGAEWTDAKAPKFHQLIADVLKVTGVVNETAKKKYQRLRPYQQHPDTVHSLFPVGGFSYPSGHSMGSFTLAIVLGEVFPDKRKALLDRAARIAQSRVNAGVHNPSDIQEGEKLGRATAAAIIASPAFQTDLAAVKRELGK